MVLSICKFNEIPFVRQLKGQHTNNILLIMEYAYYGRYMNEKVGVSKFIIVDTPTLMSGEPYYRFSTLNVCWPTVTR